MVPLRRCWRWGALFHTRAACVRNRVEGGGRIRGAIAARLRVAALRSSAQRLVARSLAPSA
eukprot:8430145-Alexandrium_andersonii.AAC.1